MTSDICKALDLSNPTMAVQRLDEDEKAKFNLGLSGGETNCVNEYGLYSLVLASRKKEAKEFKRWITHEVLPSIRKHGMYYSSGGCLSEGYKENSYKVNCVWHYCKYKRKRRNRQNG